MTIYSVNAQGIVPEAKKNWYHEDEDFFILAGKNELKRLDAIFHFDPYTILECVNLDENIRFDSYKGYDFISLIYFYLDGQNMIFSEINLYVGKNYILFVLPDDHIISGDFLNYFRNVQHSASTELTGLLNIYYKIFHKIMTDLFEAMEKYEEIIFATEREVIQKARKGHLHEIIEIKSTTGEIKKLLRPLLYIGDQFMVNENNLIPDSKMKFFKNIDIRMNKIYDFAVNLYEMSEQLLFTYDSKINMQTNEIVTRLTVVTVFIGPLTVITGIYGMNFTNMPELNATYAYPVVLLIMFCIVLVLYFYFKKKDIL